MSSKEAQRVAVVTGASSGIGAALTRRLLSEGWKVALVARRTRKMREVCEGFDPSSYLVCSADLSVNSQSIDAVNQIREWLKQCCDGRLDLLVNNVGGPIKNDSFSKTADDFEFTLRLNLISAFIFLSGLKPALLRSSEQYKNEPSVVNVGSVAGHKVLPSPLYAVAKAGLHHLSQLAALELAPNQIRVNTVAPGTIETSVLKSLGYPANQIAAYYQQSPKRYPIGRIGTVKDTTEMIMFLADPKKSGWITGQTIFLDGGYIQQSAGFQIKKLPIPSKI